MPDNLLISHLDYVLKLTINRPHVRNAINPDTMSAIHAALREAENNPSVRVVLITGAEGHFCAGADIQDAMATGFTPDSAHSTLTDIYGPTLLAIRDFPMPVIAAVDGYAAGIGCDLALRCDLRVVSENAKFSELFIRVGLIPDGGGTFMLPRLVGLGRGMELMFTGRSVPAEEAVTIGLANRILQGADFQAEAEKFAHEIAAGSPLALRRGKSAMLAALEGGTYADALRREADFQKELFSSEDGIEGFMAFLEKRPAQWKGR